MVDDENAAGHSYKVHVHPKGLFALAGAWNAGTAQWKRVDHGWVLDCEQNTAPLAVLDGTSSTGVVRACCEAGAARWDETWVGTPSARFTKGFGNGI
ncbi:hypothetical protein CORC01_01997 [Colletotrichum orchidophilum]|uniref:Uncharacterized protein n=1 Tax=Colletotrichum orchidophilum TaxID=1209926 RepID=A0A1G4BMD0_9PEZI|nr:uncharacterized protein CORC01_01997 [Colletotrichum orchidophilum]OHF02601.1 hypothetical protein CORC01_01997 [Colletotrichum orchidophilum]